MGSPSIIDSYEGTHHSRIRWRIYCPCRHGCRSLYPASTELPPDTNQVSWQFFDWTCPNLGWGQRRVVHQSLYVGGASPFPNIDSKPTIPTSFPLLPLGRSQNIQLLMMSGTVLSSVDLGMRAAVYNGLLNPDHTTSNLNPDCATRNCTWNPFTTLGFCSRCGDVTPAVAEKCIENLPAAPKGGFACNYTLPGGILSKVEFYIDEHRRSAGPNMSVAALKPQYTGFDPPYPPASVLGYQNPLFAFGRIYHDRGTHVVVNATECVLVYCIQTLEVSVTNGKLHTKTLATWHNESGSLPYSVSGKGINYTFLNPPPGSIPIRNPGNLSFFVSQGRNHDLQSWFFYLFRGFSFESSSYQIDARSNGNDLAVALYYGTDLSMIMAHIADRMTDNIRSQSRDQAFGTVWKIETYVSVRWPWLVLPVGLVLLSVALLIATIVSSHRHRCVVWKSDSLATLFHGLSDDRRYKRLYYLRQMEKAAEGVEVQLTSIRNKP